MPSPTSILFASPITADIRRHMSATETLDRTMNEAARKSSQHCDEWAEPKTLKRDPSMSDAEWLNAIDRHYEEWYTSVTDSLLAQFEAHNNIVKEVQRVLDNGLSIARGRAVIRDAERKLAEINKQSLNIMRHKYALKGRFLDTFASDTTAVMSLIDMVIQRYPESMASIYRIDVDCAVDLDGMREGFRKDLVKRYDAKHPDLTAMWCPIARDWVLDCRGADIVPYNAGELHANHLFGEPETPLGHLMHPSNGLFIHEHFVNAMDGGAIHIVPASKGDIDPQTQTEVDFSKDPEPYKLCVLNKSWLDKALRYGEVKSEHLHGRILEFRTNFRPRKCYLWYNAIINILRRRRTKVDGWQNDIAALGNESWATPGEHLRHSTMSCIAETIGFMNRAEFEELCNRGPNLNGSADERTFMCREAAALVLAQFSPPRPNKF